MAALARIKSMRMKATGRGLLRSLGWSGIVLLSCVTGCIAPGPRSGGGPRPHARPLAPDPSEVRSANYRCCRQNDLIVGLQIRPTPGRAHARSGSVPGRNVGRPHARLRAEDRRGPVGQHHNCPLRRDGLAASRYAARSAARANGRSYVGFPHPWLRLWLS